MGDLGTIMNKDHKDLSSIMNKGHKDRALKDQHPLYLIMNTKGLPELCLIVNTTEIIMNIIGLHLSSTMTTEMNKGQPRPLHPLHCTTILRSNQPFQSLKMTTELQF